MELASEESPAELDKAVLETIDKLTISILEDEQNGETELMGPLVIVDISSSECSKSNSPMPEGIKESSLAIGSEQSKAPLGQQPTQQPPPPLPSHIQSIPPKKAANVKPAAAAANIMSTITLKKMPIQPTPVAKILPKKPSTPRPAVVVQQNAPPPPPLPMISMDLKQKLTSKLIRVTAAQEKPVGPSRLVNGTPPMMATTAIATGQLMAAARSNLVPIRPKVRPTIAAAAIPMPPPPSAAAAEPPPPPSEDHLAATVDKVAAGKEISPKQLEAAAASVPAPVAPPPKKPTKSRKKKPPAVPPSTSEGGQTGPNQAMANFMVQAKDSGGMPFPQSVQSTSNGIFAQNHPQFALAPNGNLVAVSTGGMTHFLIRQQPSHHPAMAAHFIPFMPPGQLFLSPVQQMTDPKSQQQIPLLAAPSLVPPAQGGAPSAVNHRHPPSNHPNGPKMTTANSAAAGVGGQHQQIVVDEEENEPPPVLDKTTQEEEPAETASGGTAQLLESIFQREAKIIRERFSGPRGKRGGPIVHEIDGFRIEEHIEPFPVENRRMLEELKGREKQGEDGEGKSTTESPPEERGAKKGGQKRKGGEMGTSPEASSKKRERKGGGGGTSTPQKSTATPTMSMATTLKGGGKRELKGLLEMDFGPGKTPFQTSDPDEYAEEVMIEARKHARLMSEERPNSSSSRGGSGGAIGKRGERERSNNAAAPPSNLAKVKQEKKSPNQQKEGAKERGGGGGERSSEEEEDEEGEGETEDEEGGHCHNCRRSFREGRYQGHEQYCSRECYKMRKRMKKMKKSSREESSLPMNNGGIGNERSPSSPMTIVQQNRRSDPSAAMPATPSGGTFSQPAQQKWTSPLGSAFAAVQPQMATGAMMGRGGGNSPAGDQQPPQQLFPSPGPSSAGALGQMMIGGHQQPPIVAAHQYNMGAAAAAYFHHHQQQFVHPHHHHHLGMPSTSAAFFPQFHQMMAQPPPSAGPMMRSPPAPPHMVHQSPPMTPGTPGTPLGPKSAAEIENLMARGIHNWTPEEVAKWVNFVTNSSINGEAFVQQEIDGSSLLLLTCEQLQNELKLKLGPAVKVQNALNAHKPKYNLL